METLSTTPTLLPASRSQFRDQNHQHSSTIMSAASQPASSAAAPVALPRLSPHHSLNHQRQVTPRQPSVLSGSFRSYAPVTAAASSAVDNDATSGAQPSHVRTPEEQDKQIQNGTMTSPIELASPSTRHKRTSSGQVKAATVVSPVRATSASGSSPVRDKRADSVSSNGSRVGEAAAQLKTRLAYAMAKVQHGWQNHNLDQVEVLASQLPPRANRSSPSSKRLSARFAPTADTLSPRASAPATATAPSPSHTLAVPTTPTAKRRHHSQHRPIPSPHLRTSTSAGATAAAATASSSSSSSSHAQAEQDAIASLMLMHSPSSRLHYLPHTTATTAIPLSSSSSPSSPGDDAKKRKSIEASTVDKVASSTEVDRRNSATTVASSSLEDEEKDIDGGHDEGGAAEGTVSGASSASGSDGSRTREGRERVLDEIEADASPPPPSVS